MWSTIFASLIDRHQNLVSAIRWWLLGGDILATWMVGAGILWESEALNINHGIARRFVFIGVVLETLCSVGLFWFDDNVSDAQQSKIIALERAAAPRNIQDGPAFVAALKKFGGTPYDLGVPSSLEPGSSLLSEVIGDLRNADWKLQSMEGNVTKGTLNPLIADSAMDLTHVSGSFSAPIITVGQLVGSVGIGIDWNLGARNLQFNEAAVALRKAFLDAGIEAHFTIHDAALTGDAIHIMIGTKP